MAAKMMTVGAYKKGGGKGSYEEYMKAAKAGGMEYEDEPTYKAVFGAEDEGNGKDDEEEEEEDTEKAEINTADLVKSLEAFDTIDEALAGSGGRRDFLESRLHAGTISDLEKAELGRIWTGGNDLNKSDHRAATTPRTSITDRIAADSDVNAELINGNDFLKSLVEGVETSMDLLHREHLSDSEATRQLIKAQGGLLRGLVQHNIELSDALSKSMSVIDRLGKRLDDVEKTPAQRRAVGTHSRGAVLDRDLAKGGAGGGDLRTPINNGNDLTKSQVATGIRSLLAKAEARGDNAAIDRLVHAGALLESGAVLPANVEEAIRMELGQAVA